MKTNKLLIAITFLLISSCAISKGTLDSDIDNIINSIKVQDKEVFSSYFSDKNLTPTEKEYEYYFGETKDFFKKNGIEYTIFSEDEVSTYTDGSIAVVVFYDSTKINSVETIDWDWIGKNWMQKVLVLELRKVRGHWKFIKTPFYFFRHAPWANDYG